MDLANFAPLFSESSFSVHVYAHRLQDGPPAHELFEAFRSSNSYPNLFSLTLIGRPEICKSELA